MSDKQMYRADLGSWSKWVEVAKRPNPDKDSMLAETNSSHEKTDRYGMERDWYGTQNFAEAVELCEKGWPEGVKKIERLSVQFKEMLTHKVFKPVLVHDVWGDTVDVGRFNAGLPDAMMHWEQSDIVQKGYGQRIVHIVFNLTVSAGVSTRAIEQRGAAVLALVDALEAAGKRVKIDLVYGCTGTGSPYKQIALWTNLKQPDMPLQLDQVAFAVVHPSSLRRIGFAIAEHMPPDVQESIGWGYGHPPFDVVSKEEQGDIYMASGNLYATDWEDENKVRKWIEDQLKKFGVLIDEDEHFER